MEDKKLQKSLRMSIIGPTLVPLSLPDLDNLLTEVIGSAAEECLKLNNGEICTTLSGGLDSSFCLAKIREIVGQKVKINTFTIGPEETYPDIQYARRVAKLFHTVHTELIPSYSEMGKARAELAISSPGGITYPGDLATFMIYQEMSKFGQRCVIAHDGIDELLGGYWEHRRHKNAADKLQAFTDLWSRLWPEHIQSLQRKAEKFGIKVILPYLHPDLVSFLNRISLDERTSRTVSKIPLRTLAKKYLPLEIIERSKLGFCGALGEGN